MRTQPAQDVQVVQSVSEAANATADRRTCQIKKGMDVPTIKDDNEQKEIDSA